MYKLDVCSTAGHLLALALLTLGCSESPDATDVTSVETAAPTEVLGGTGETSSAPKATDDSLPSSSGSESPASDSSASDAAAHASRSFAMPTPFSLPCLSTCGTTTIATAVFALEAKLDHGWSVSRVSGDLTAPDVLSDGGSLSGFAVGDRIRVSGRQSCQPFSGCKWFVVVRDAADERLIAASFNDDPRNMPGFVALLGAPIATNAICTTGPTSRCYEGEFTTWYSLQFGAGESVTIEPQSQQPLAIGGQLYTAWLGAAYSVEANGPFVRGSSECQDAAGLFWSGAVRLTIAR